VQADSAIDLEETGRFLPNASDPHDLVFVHERIGLSRWPLFRFAAGRQDRVPPSPTAIVPLKASSLLRPCQAADRPDSRRPAPGTLRRVVLRDGRDQRPCCPRHPLPLDILEPRCPFVRRETNGWARPATVGPEHHSTPCGARGRGSSCGRWPHNSPGAPPLFLCVQRERDECG